MRVRLRAPRLRLKSYLDRLYHTYDLSYVSTSALKFPRRYHRSEDIEVVAFIASCFAYGRVQGFTPPIDALLGVLGPQPSHFILQFNPQHDGDRLREFVYRFNTARDASCLLWLLRQALERYGSLHALILRGYSNRHPDTRPALATLVEQLLGLDPRPVYGRGQLSTGMRYLLPDPRRGGACKRLHLFLRWMVRRDHIDFGLWPELKPAQLIIPLDTHVAQVSRQLGLTRLKSPSLAMALDITEKLKRFDAADPVRYDFALCRLGMLGDRSGLRVEGAE